MMLTATSHHRSLLRVASCAVLALPVVSAGQRPRTGDSAVVRALDALDSVASERTSTGRFSGVVLVAALDGRGGRPLFEKAYGASNLADGTLNATDTRFITASTAKSFTAVAVATLAQDGRLRYDAALSSYLPDSLFPAAVASQISIRQLLTHTAGLGDVIASKAFRSAPQSFTTLAQLVALVREQLPAGPPGTFRYADADYILLGAVVERVSGKPFADYVRDHVFRPAGMTGSSFAIVPRPPNLAHGYTVRDLGGAAYALPGTAPNGSPLAPLHANDAILPGVGVPSAVAYTTARDLARFADAIRGNRILNTANAAELWAPRVETGQAAANPANGTYAYGFFVGTVGPNRIVNHGGTGPGIDVAFDIYPDLGYVAIVLANRDPPAAQDIRAFLREAFARTQP